MVNDLAYSLKEIVDEIKKDMKMGFDKQSTENAAIRQSIVALKDELKAEFEVKYARKASVNRLWGIIWGGIVLVGQYLIRMLLDLLTNHSP